MSAFTDLLLVLVLVLVGGVAAWFERERISRWLPFSQRPDATQSGAQPSYYWRLTRQAGLSPSFVWPIYLGAKIAVPILLPLLVMEATGAGAMALLLAPIAFFFPDAMLAWMRRSRIKRVRQSLSFFLDLLLSLVQAGLGLEEALGRAAREGLPEQHPLRKEVLQLLDEVRVGRDRTTGYQALADRTGAEELRSLASAIGVALSRGTPLEATLKAHADLARAKRREDSLRRLETANAEVLVPLMLCSFPLFVVLVFAPLALQVFQSLRELAGVLR